jgi:hypothetical protein
MQTDYAGIDYSAGVENRDKETGIHYGVISQHSLHPESANDIYFKGSVYTPYCPKCGNEIAEENAEEGYTCECGYEIKYSEEMYGDEPSYIDHDSGDGIRITGCLDSDFMILKSPYYTHAQFCSPCVPGAGNLNSPCPNGPKTYCLPSDYFGDEGAPYPIFLVETNERVS